MLRELNIENVAVIQKAAVQFFSGLNILTGETGAGKSILIDSINAILGNRTTREIVRNGADKAVIWAMFDGIDGLLAKRIGEEGYDCDGGELVLYREISADGKSQCRINGKPATAATVRDICNDLINIHGQHDNQSLLNPQKHITIIDSFCEIDDRLCAYRETYSKLASTKRAIDKLTFDEAEKERRIDLLSYQIDEIRKAELIEGEDKELSDKRNLIKNSEKILEALESSHELLFGGEEGQGALDMVFAAADSLESVSDCSKNISDWALRLRDTYYLQRDIAEELTDYLDDFDFDAAAVAEVDERIDLIYKLKRKYGETIEDILSFLGKSEDELATIESAEEQLKKLNRQYDELLKLANSEADAISDIRHASFPIFENKIKEELSFLNMPNVKIVVDCKRSQLTPNGFDTIEFFISTNVGEPPKPLSKIASGGELSRIMLALKNALADVDNTPTLIFDEIDTGVSGSGAQKIGHKLKQVSKCRQIICVTHSAQVAAYADVHLRIEKSVRDERTYTSISTLERSERVSELARIVSGDKITQTSLSNAAEMLELAEKD
ncbi:MAG: DNA repair protein RecN [Oscillospiraceae bacterium]